MMAVRPIDIDKLPDDESPLQTPFWARLKEGSGWTCLGVDIDQKPLLVLQKRIIPGFELSYVPMAALEGSSLPEIARSLGASVCSHSFAVRFDLPPGVQIPPKHGKLLNTGYTIQPEATVHVDLEPELQRLYDGFSKRVRRHIRKGERQLYTTAWNGTDSQLDQWYRLYEQTSRREGFSLRPKSYIRDMLTAYNSERVYSRLFLCYQDDELTAGIIVLFAASQALYLYGASQRGEGIVSGSYVLQWQAIREAKAHGCRLYDLGGTAPLYTEAVHHLGGLNMFKTGFSSEIITRAGCFDYVVHDLRYKLYINAERLRIQRNRR
jgi:lipid II:glycine glycyltransferase (peptidoglycan interpeptide bridge formation enzyme)